MKKKRLALIIAQAHLPPPVKQRMRFLVLGIWLVTCLLVVRLYDLMVQRGDQFRELADSNRFFTKLVLPNRGVIFDRNGKLLVQNMAVFKMAKEGETVAHPQLTTVDSATAYTLLLHQPQRLYEDTTRVQIFPQILSHVLGYTGFAGGGELANVASLNQKVGKTGAEALFDATLRGTAGSETYEMSAPGQLLRLTNETPAISGNDVTLSVDASLSGVAFNALAGRPGSVVVSDVATGQVLTLVSSPSFTMDTLAASLQDSSTPLIDRGLHAYPPGSVFKMIVALAGLEKKAIDKDTLIKDEGQLKVGEATFGNWYYSEYGRTEGDINVVKAITRSNDIFFYKLAALVGPNEIAAMANKFHLGRLTGFELSEEETGTIPTPQWKDKQKGEKWYLGDTYHMGIGQGDVLVTPMQLNAMTAALARQGTWCVPTLQVDKTPACEDLNLQSQNLETVKEGMVGACSHGGTAFPFFPWNETASDSAKVACKTGTAEHGAANEKGYRKTDAWFTMYYPVGIPKVAITVMLESTGDKPFLEGSADAAPIAKSIWEAWKATYEK